MFLDSDQSSLPGVEENMNTGSYSMSKSAVVRISNLTNRSVTTRVVRDRRVHDGGNAINNKTIAAGAEGVFRLVAKTDHHGEIDIDLVENSLPRKLIGKVVIRNMAEPEAEIDGKPSTFAFAEEEGFFVSALGSSSPTQRRINVLLVQNQKVKLQS